MPLSLWWWWWCRRVTSAPIRDTVRSVFGHGGFSVFLCVAAIIGLLASLHSILYAAAHQYTSMAHAGFVPSWFSARRENLVSVR